MDERVAVTNSSNIESYAYSTTRGVLIIEFKNGAEWEYKGVPESVFLDMKKAESKGQFFATRVKPFYQGGRVK